MSSSKDKGGRERDRVDEGVADWAAYKQAKMAMTRSGRVGTGPMKDKDERERAVVGEDAAEWYVKRASGMSPAERDAFAAWLTRSPLHIREYVGVDSVARELKTTAPGDFDLDELVRRAREEPDVLPAQGSARAPRPVLPWLAAAASVAALGILAFYGWSAWQGQRPLAHAPAVVEHPAVAQVFETRRGQQSTQQLADGSVMHLNTDTRVTVIYSASRRAVVLTRGQAVFDVVHDSQRPFSVSTESVEVTDVGTKFDVHLEDDATVITVVEGRVAVAPAPVVALSASARAHGSPSSRPVEVGANQQLTVSSEDWPAAPKTVDAQRATSWLRRQIVFEHEPLEQVAAEFNRYAPTPIEIASPALRQLQISGVFSTDDPEAFIAFLRSLDGVRVDVTPTRVLVEGKAGRKGGH